MRAMLLREFGPPDRLHAVELPEPAAGPNEVLIDVEVAGITFVETQIRAGRPPHPAMLPTLPAVLGNGVAGVIIDVGEGGDKALIGRRVVSSLNGTGGYAERAIASSAAVLDVPEGLASRDAAALVADGRTAQLALRRVQPAPGETALVLAAGGGVGSLLVQLARAAGALVVAAAGEQPKLELARSLGAELAVDYSRPDWAINLDSFDVVFDGVGGAVGRAAFERLRSGGRLLRLGMASGSFTEVTGAEAAARGVTLVDNAPAKPELLRSLAAGALALAAHGELVPTIGQTYPLERAGEAHAAIEARTTLGKTLLMVR